MNLLPPLSTSSDASLIALAESWPDGLAWIDRTGCLGYANPVFASTLGRAPQELIGMDLGALGLAPACIETWETHLRSAFERPEESAEFECPGPSGTGWFHVRLMPLASEGLLERVLAIVHDVSRLKAHEARQHAELAAAAKLHQVIKILDQPRDVDDVINEVLDFLLEAFGADRAWIIHLRDPDSETFQVPFERTRPEFPGSGGPGNDLPLKGGMRDIMHAVMAADHPITYGPDRPFPEDMRPLFEALSLQAQMLTIIHPRIGKPWVLGIHQCTEVRRWSALEQQLFQDIAERLRESLNTKLFLAEVASSVSLLRATLEANADGVLVIGTDGTIRSYNQRLLDMWGLTEAQMQAPRTAVPCMSDQLKDPEGFQARVRELYAQPEAESYDLLELKDGRIFERFSLPQRLGDTVVGRLWSYRDITAIRQAEVDLARYARELEAAYQELQAADRYKDEFLSVISHELRTPLNCITGFASIMESEQVGPVNSTQRDYLERIVGGADRMLGLINNLLDMGRMRAGKFQIDPYETDFPPIVLDVIATLAPLAQDKGIRVEPTLEISQLVTLDATRITQVLTNLLDNAIKFSPEGGRIRIRSYLTTDRLVTEVQDSGPGIAAEDVPRLWAPFKQLDMGSTRKVQGAGLGLSICKAIVEAHGGILDVESQPGSGSTFRFELPLRP